MFDLVARRRRLWKLSFVVRAVRSAAIEMLRRLLVRKAQARANKQQIVAAPSQLTGTKGERKIAINLFVDKVPHDEAATQRILNEHRDTLAAGAEFGRDGDRTLWEVTPGKGGYCLAVIDAADMHVLIIVLEQIGATLIQHGGRSGHGFKRIDWLKAVNVPQHHLAIRGGGQESPARN